MSTKRRIIGPVTKSAYIRMLTETGNHVLACEAIGVSRKDILRLIERDPVFAERVEEARSHAVERLEGEAYRRAVVGIEEPVFYKGVCCGHVRKYSDSLLSRLLEANDPRFSRSIKVSGGDIPQEPQHDLSKLSIEELKQLQAILSASSLGGQS